MRIVFAQIGLEIKHDIERLHGPLGTKASDIAMAATSRRIFAERREGYKDFLSSYAHPTCQKCGGEGSYLDSPVEIPGQWIAMVLSVSQDCCMVRAGDFIDMPKGEIEHTEYVRNPERQLCADSRGLWLVDDEDRIVQWKRGKAIIATREDVRPWLIIGNLCQVQDDGSETPSSDSGNGANVVQFLPAGSLST